MTFATSAPVGHVVCDDRSCIVDANEAARRLLGYPASELRGAPLTSILSKAATAFFQMQVYPTLAQEQRLEEAYISLRAKDGAFVPVLLNAERVSAGDSVENHLVFLPMRRRQLFERELVEAQRAAEKARAAEQAALLRIQAMQAKLALQDRLATIGTMVAGVVHDLNNPLLYTASNLELIDEELSATPADVASVRDMLRDAREGVDRITKLVQGLRSYSRAECSSQELVDLASVIQSSIRMTTHATRTRAHTLVELKRSPALVLGDETRLTQVLVNLLLNAAQAFRIAEPQRNRIQVSLDCAGADRAVVQVSDNGPGVPRELERRIFEPFFTTKPVGEGTGLGLAICAEILASMGGGLELQNAPGVGACFRIELPLATVAAEAKTLATGS